MHNHLHGGSIRLWQRRLILSILITLPVICLAVSDWLTNYIAFDNFLAPWRTLISAILATIAILYLGASFFHSTIRGLRQCIFNVDSLITIGTTTAYVYSLISYLGYILNHSSLTIDPLVDDIHVYFNTVIYLFTFVVLGKWLEARTTKKTELSIRRLIQLKPHEAHLLNGKNVISIPVASIKVGDHLVVHPGEIIPVDGRVIDGTSTVNESMLTGENAPVNKQPDSPVIAGTTNGHGELRILAERVANDTMLAKIIHLIKTAQTTPSTIVTAADRLANVFVPSVIIAALISFAVWYFWLNADLSSAMMTFVSVIMIACPCAIGLAAPSAITTGINLASRHGILIKNSRVMQQLSRIDTVVFDKTGTLTDGEPIITNIIPVKSDVKHALVVVASFARHSSQPILTAADTRAKKRHLQPLPVKDFTATSTEISGTINNITYRLSMNNTLDDQTFPDTQLATVKKLDQAGKTVYYLTTDQQLLAIFAMTDQTKVNAAKTIQELHGMRIDTYLLSGDSNAATAAAARTLGIKHYLAEVVSDTKATEIIKLRRAGRRLAMVGDGINDAPAIASANVGIALGTGADTAIETGDVVLVSGDPLSICDAIRASKITTHKVYQNLFFSLFYNAISIPIAAGVFSGWGITTQPALAGLIMVMSTLAVIINSLTLRLVNIHKQHQLISLIAPISLFILFSAVYLMFIFARV